VRNVIAGLARPLCGLLRRDDRGVVGVLVALLIGGGALVAMGAMVIDVGQLYQERAELQNGADAAAIAVAKSCLTGTCSSTIAAQYANENTSALTGGKAGVSQVCGSGSLGACPASSGAMTDCPSAPSGGLGYADVHTSTKLANGSTLLPPVFAETLLGNGSYLGTTVLACAQAAWSGPSSANTLAFTISACSWDSWTSLGTSFAPAPPASPSSSYDHQLNLKYLNNATGCSTEVSGSDGPGAFGWTVDQTGNCGIFTNSTTYPGNTGASAGSTCQTALAAAQASRKAVFIPVYTSSTGTGGTTVFTLKGFGAFVVTGYHLPGFTASDWLNSSNNCTGNDKCINGYFTQALIPPGTGGGQGGTYLGAAVISLTG
jgi:hypothetical protein